MTSLVRSFSAQLRDLEKRIREEQPSSGETPEGNFARHVFEAVAEEGPVADWGPEVESAPLRKGMAPALSAFGYRITRRHHAPKPD